MKIYAMSDIHGYLQEFETALSKVDLSGDNILVLLGDYIHGPNSYKVLDKIISLQGQYGNDKVIALIGNHEEMAIDGSWPIGQNKFINHTDPCDQHKDSEYLRWMAKLPYYHVVGNTILVHAGIDEEYAAAGYWEYTDEKIFTSKSPAETGKIDNFGAKIVAGHIGANHLANDRNYHDIYFDGGSHYYIDGTVQKSHEIPVLVYDVQQDKYYRATDSGEWLILPYDEEN